MTLLILKVRITKRHQLLSKKNKLVYNIKRPTLIRAGRLTHAVFSFLFFSFSGSICPFLHLPYSPCLFLPLLPLPSSPFSPIISCSSPALSVLFSSPLSSSVLSLLFSSPSLFPVLFVAVLQRPLLPFPKHTAAAGSITKKGKHLITKCLPLLQVIPRGFEPRTHSLEGCCSIQLSYETITGECQHHTEVKSA